MVRIPRLPKLPNPENVFSVLDKASDAIETGLNIIDKAANKLDQAAAKFDPWESTTPATATETLKEPPPGQDETSPSPGSISAGTACLPCSRDHLSVTSSSLSEGIRFARDKGVRQPEVTRRIRIALDELNVMERIDLAPEETAKLKGAEKELAGWILTQSRDLRHAITSIKDVGTMEQAAARASQVTEEFMSRLWSIPEGECDTCSEVRERLREFIERRQRERGDFSKALGNPGPRVLVEDVTELVESGRYLVRGAGAMEKRLGIPEEFVSGGVGGTWATRDIEYAREYGEPLSFIETPRKILSIGEGKEVFEGVDFGKVTWEEMRDFAGSRGYDAIEFLPGFLSTRNEIWILERPKLLSAEDLRAAG